MIQNEERITDSDRDSLHTIPLSIIPLQTPSLRRARLVKNNRLESVVELFKEEATGSGHLTIDALEKTFDWPPDSDQSDLITMHQLAALPSYDVYSLRIQLRKLDVPVNDYSDLNLSDKKRSQLSQYMTTFTMPLMVQIFSDGDSEIRTIDDIYALFKDPDNSKARDRLSTIAEKLEIELDDVPKFLDDYGDIYLSLCYYRQCMDQVAPSIADLVTAIGSVRDTWQLKQDARLMKTCDFVESSLNELAAQVTGRLESFDRNSKDLWNNISADQFRKIETLVKSYHISLGGALCTLSVKMGNWQRTFPHKKVNPMRAAEFITTEMKQGLDKIRTIEGSFSTL